MAYAENVMLQSPGYIVSIAFCMEYDACAFGLRTHVLYTLDCNTVLVCMFLRQTASPLEGWQKGRLFIFIPEICVSTRFFSTDFAWCERCSVVLSYGVRIVILWYNRREDKNLWLTKGVPGTNTIQKLQLTVYEIIWYSLQIVSNSPNSSDKWYFWKFCEGLFTQQELNMYAAFLCECMGSGRRKKKRNTW